MRRLYTQIELFGDAINNLEAASKIWLKLYPDGHQNLAFVCRSLGRTYVKMGTPRQRLSASKRHWHSIAHRMEKRTPRLHLP